MSHIAPPCIDCAANGWIICSQCGRPHCWDHCVGHGCPETSARPTMPIPSSANDPAYLFHHWCWSRLDALIRAVPTLSLSDPTTSRYITIVAPSPSDSESWYYYKLAGVGLETHKSPLARTFIELVRDVMPLDHQIAFFTMLGIFVTAQRNGARQRIAALPTLIIELTT